MNMTICSSNKLVHSVHSRLPVYNYYGAWDLEHCNEEFMLRNARDYYGLQNVRGNIDRASLLPCSFTI